MKYITVPGFDQKLSQMALGTMRIQKKTKDANGNKIYVGKPIEEVETLIKTALDLGINVIDTADIYGHGVSEELIGQVIERNPELRDKMIIQTKCGCYSTSEGYCYNLSKEYILEAVDASLERLKTDHIDILLLHKPDPLMVPKEIGEAFDELYAAKKVLNFGVSNFTASQLSLLKKNCSRPIIFNQVQFSIAHSSILDSQIQFNTNGCVDRDGGILNYCMENDVTMQAYSVMQGSDFDAGRSFVNNPNYQKLNELMDSLCEKYNTNKNAIAIAWILKHPANIIPVIGTTNPAHIKDSLEAFDFELSRHEWYKLYQACEKPLP